MSMMPRSAYPVAKCGIYVEGGVASYPCSLPKDHEGPCFAIEVESSRHKRERWEKENPEKVEQAKRALEDQGGGDPPVADPSSPFVEDQPDPVVEANRRSGRPKSLPGTESMQRHMDEDAARHAVTAMEEIVDALAEVLPREEVSDDPVAAVQRLVAMYDYALDEAAHGSEDL